MGLTSRKRRPLNRAIPYLRDTKLVIIASEGERTEKQYFEDIFGSRSPRVQVKVLETQAGTSAPKHVLSRLKNYVREIPLFEDDELWLVIDKDRWPNEQLHKVAQECWRCSFGLAVSCPCFEVWLFLHFTDATPDMQNLSSGGIKYRLRIQLGGYNQSSLDTSRFMPYYVDAMRRAIQLDVNPSATWPDHLGTHVYKVVRAIEALLSPPGASH